MAPPSTPRVRVREFWRARIAGLSTEAATAAVGVSVRTADRWVTESGGVIPDLAEPSGRFLSLAEREEIAEGWAGGLSRGEIARRLGRHPTTVGRELRRNQAVGYSATRSATRPATRSGVRSGARHERLRYRPSLAQAKADERARRPKPTKLSRCPELREQIIAWLVRRWSPAQIARTLRRDFPDRPEMHVSHETIYQELYVQARGELRRDLARCLRTGRAVRRPHRLPDRRRRRSPFPPEIMISARPAEVADRAVPGHWEGDDTGKAT
jgi:transposase, IS30 family